MNKLRGRQKSSIGSACNKQDTLQHSVEERVINKHFTLPLSSRKKGKLHTALGLQSKYQNNFLEFQTNVWKELLANVVIWRHPRPRPPTELSYMKQYVFKKEEKIKMSRLTYFTWKLEPKKLDLSSSSDFLINFENLGKLWVINFKLLCLKNGENNSSLS